MPCQSIFNRKKPLAVNTQRRIARGLDKFVIKESKPFIVSTGATRFGLIAPALIQYNSETAKAEVRGQSLNNPIMTIDSSPRHGVFIPYLLKYYGGVVGADMQSPMPTVTAIDHNALSLPFLTQYYSGANHANTVCNPLQTITVQPRHFLCDAYLTILRNNMDCRSVNESLNTITTSGAHSAYIKVHVKKYRPGCNLYNWSKVRELLTTYTDWNLADDEILIFNINGVEQFIFIYDIGLRMLQPK